MERRLQGAPELADWFDKLGPRAIRIASPRLAQRLRSDSLSILETNFACQDEEQRWRLGQLLVTSVVNALHMECLMSGGPTTAYGSNDSKRFLIARNLLHEHLEDLESITSGSFLDMKQLGARRTVEKAFSSSIKMGPLTYFRIVRLHDARRKLMDREAAYQPISDIAAELGFFDAGKFTAAYRKHFGELPSVTRNVALGRDAK